MANINLYKGGTPVPRYKWCEGDYAQFQPPFQTGLSSTINGIYRTPPYDSHFDGVQAVGYYTGWMPIVPAIMPGQKNAFRNGPIAVDDIIQCIWIPVDHYATFLNFKVQGEDPRLAGATVSLTAQTVTMTNGEPVYAEIQDVENAAAAQGYSAPIAIDTTSNTFISLMRVASSASLAVTGTNDAGSNTVTGTATGEVAGYVRPLYSAPNVVTVLGLKIVALPTDDNVTLDMMNNAMYMSAKIEGFECATQV